MNLIYYLLEGPTLVLEIQTNFIWVALYCSLKHLRNSPVHFLVDVNHQKQTKVSESPPCISTRSVIEEVESVVTARQQVRQQDQTCCGYRGE